ncbi:MAG: TetR/AcrR family transcriptional regulator [Gammaproteobacteria bacterium]|jgi:AcrR family transcriptional regulator|nr:TetR/AcrR family transcriptional regulator [Gammaproteobacteria bacterium]
MPLAQRSNSRRNSTKTDAHTRSRGGAREAVAERGTAMIAVALELFARRHFAAVTIKQIAGELGVNTALLYYYFESKEDLLRATIEHTVQRAFAHFDMLRACDDDPAEIIADWLASHVDLSEPIQKLVKISLDYRSSDIDSPAIERAIRRFYDGERRMLMECIESGIAAGRFQAVDAAQVSQFVSTYLDGLMVRAMVQPRFDLKKAMAQFSQMLWRELGVREDTLAASTRAPMTSSRRRLAADASARSRTRRS